MKVIKHKKHFVKALSIALLTVLMLTAFIITVGAESSAAIGVVAPNAFVQVVK